MACDAFITYAGKDRAVAGTIVEALERAGLVTWWDQYLLPDEPFNAQIQRVLVSSKLILALLSREALASPWVRWELSQASQNELPIVPILFGGARPEQLPAPLDPSASLRIANNDDTNAVSIVVERVSELVGARSHGDSLSIGSLADGPTNEARRRLASAAAEVARSAGSIRLHNQKLRSPSETSLEDALQVSYSDGLAAFLAQTDISVGFTSLDHGQLLVLGLDADREVVVRQQPYGRAMGLHGSGNALVLATFEHILRLERRPPIDPRLGLPAAPYTPQRSHRTGPVDAHDVGLGGDGAVIFVSSRHNCLAATTAGDGFRKLWSPQFVDESSAEDRCHLNGLAMQEGKPAFVTALARTNAFFAWRSQMAAGGIVIDVNDNREICSGLSMPHSPRMHDGQLWVLNSGAGELGTVDTSGARGFAPVASMPGLARGLAFHQHVAVVGLSRPRYGAFGGLPLQQRLAGQMPWCGLQFIDTRSGAILHWVRLEGSIVEVYDVAVLSRVEAATSS
ncbi:MAG: TIGR03032 family protein [Myxococcales bacterium]|nr:MAG: TIGR03032 family protein [Myxococcales bacterium]